MVQKGGLTSWKAVDCELIDNTPLPINWDFSSATLNEGAKRIIDARLLPIVKDGVAVYIESHTDMRGTKRDNQDLLFFSSSGGEKLKMVPSFPLLPPSAAAGVIGVAAAVVLVVVVDDDVVVVVVCCCCCCC